MTIITKKNIDDENKEYYIDEQHIITTNHDEDGWNGMERIEKTILNIAKYLNIKINYQD